MVIDAVGHPVQDLRCYFLQISYYIFRTLYNYNNLELPMNRKFRTVTMKVLIGYNIHVATTSLQRYGYNTNIFIVNL